MQSNKAPKKTRKIADESAAAVNETKAADVKSNSRNARSSTAKKEISETSAAKHRKPSQAEYVAEPVTGKTMAAAAGAGAEGAMRVDAPVIDPVGVMTPETNTVDQTAAHAAAPAMGHVPHDEIARLAYSYWVARGYSHGNPEQDWLRAERELHSKR